MSKNSEICLTMRKFEQMFVWWFFWTSQWKLSELYLRSLHYVSKKVIFVRPTKRMLPLTLKGNRFKFFSSNRICGFVHRLRRGWLYYRDFRLFFSRHDLWRPRTIVSFAQIFLAPAARQEFECYFFFRACGADAFTIVILFFLQWCGAICGHHYYRDFATIFCHACSMARIFKANCAAVFTNVILALFLFSSYGSPCDDPIL